MAERAFNLIHCQRISRRSSSRSEEGSPLKGVSIIGVLEEKQGDSLKCRNEWAAMKIHIKVNQSSDRSPCAHRVMILNGRYLTLKGTDLRRSKERYTCNMCGKQVVRTLKTPASY